MFRDKEGNEIYKIVAVNPGSTSTKIGVYYNDRKVFIENVFHTEEEMSKFDTIQDQLGYRTLIVQRCCRANGVDLYDVDAFVGRGGGMISCVSGVYRVNEKLVYDCETAAAGVHHPAMLASQIVRRLSNKYGGRAYTVNPPDTDEMQDIARISGLKGLYRESRTHCLNQKEVARRYCDEKGLDYRKENFVIAHLGGGISVTAHCRGRMIDTSDNLAGDGPMTPTRAGSVPTTKVLKLSYSGRYTKQGLEDRLTRRGGLIDHLGTDDIIEIERRIKDNKDEYAEIVLNAMAYQISKTIGEYATVLKGDVKAIILTGGVARSERIINIIEEYVSWIAPVAVISGEYEVAALAAGAYRAMTGLEEVLEYKGVPVFRGFHSEYYNL